MNIQGTTAATPVSSAASTQGASRDAGQLNQDFLRLMVAQLRNQDPLKPMDGSEFVAQLAQLTSVECIQNMSTLQKQSNVRLDNLEVLQGSMLAGKQVTVPSDRLTLSKEESVKGQVTVDTQAPELIVVAKDASGEVIKKINLGAHNAGSKVSFELEDMKPGSYTIEAISQRGESITNHTTSLTRVVDQVSPNPTDGSIRLSVNGIGEVSMFDVQAFLGEQP